MRSRTLLKSGLYFAGISRCASRRRMRLTGGSALDLAADAAAGLAGSFRFTFLPAAHPAIAGQFASPERPRASCNRAASFQQRFGWNSAAVSTRPQFLSEQNVESLENTGQAGNPHQD